MERVIARGTKPIPQAELDRMRQFSDAIGRRYSGANDLSRAIAESIAADQQREEERRKRVAEWDKEDRRRGAERVAAFERQRAERTQAAAETLKAQARDAFLRTPGSTPEDFAKVWPEMLRQIQLDRALADLGDPTTKLADEFRAARGSGPDFFEKPRPGTGEMIDVTDEL